MARAAFARVIGSAAHPGDGPREARAINESSGEPAETIGYYESSLTNDNGCLLLLFPTAVFIFLTTLAGALCISTNTAVPFYQHLSTLGLFVYDNVIINSFFKNLV